jgi:TatD DNase family protein
MTLIDIHAHLEGPRFKDLDEVIKRAKEAGVNTIIQSGVNPSTNRKALEISEKYPGVKVSFGLYPIDALIKEVETGESEDFQRGIEPFDVDEELAWIEKNKDKCVAIGEIGLDYNWEEFQTEEAKEKQKEVFRKVLNTAKKINKPVIIHSRKAEGDAIEILEEIKPGKVIMHCFSAKKGLVKRGIEDGFYFSVPPIITRLHHFQNLVKLVPLTQLLTETDSPYLSPVGGERNEPANVAITIKHIAEIKGISEKEVADQVWKNAVEVFRLED